MAQPNVLNPHPPEFERFLYAPVGQDRNGHVVTVLSIGSGYLCYQERQSGIYIEINEKGVTIEGN
ncbi:hypothetical protein [Seohaeicola zhoushanensis]|uniref:Uncharacterized protein n=1 Tax=Seohaeicola zhoushanensis TaxID=1569283 RepID=A0A8J3H384_9RHOB|nr:hypothetical protein [Seohaeicola zhoushanensis]GHF75345.1 hypothetical protein GCM10017056_52310 [Seohaeicola zhoushanensis]